MQKRWAVAMTRAFADLHLRVNPKDQQATQRVINRAARFGYSQISIPFTSKLSEEELAKLKTKCTEAGVDFVSRTDFYPRTENDLTHFLRKFRRKFEVICITCDSKEVARQAAKDRRVDLLNFPSLDYHKRFFDHAEAELASCSLAALELDVKPLLILEGPPRVRLLTSLRREVAIAREFKVPVVVSSGVVEERLMRLPRDLASLAYLFGLDEAQALDAVSTTPAAIVARNRKKLSSRFVAPGISIVKEGKPS
jgi:ribonuclease P/MRP protein subunit RPP1